MKKLTVMLILACGLTGLCWLILPGFLAEEYARYHSPNKAFQIVVYRHRMLFSSPGQGSDAPGIIELQTSSGRLVRRQPIEMVQLTSTPQWRDGTVSMKLQFDWKLDGATGGTP